MQQKCDSSSLASFKYRRQGFFQMKRKLKITFEIEELVFVKIRKSLTGFSELDKTVLKKTTEKDGEDVLTPQLQQAAKTVLDEIAEKNRLTKTGSKLNNTSDSFLTNKAETSLVNFAKNSANGGFCFVHQSNFRRLEKY